MYRLTKEFSFDAAHMLDGHCGKCNNLHGHTYKLKIHVFANELLEDKSSKDMVIDFKDLKAIVKPIVDKLDHSFIFNKQNESESKIAKILFESGRKISEIPLRSTCENLTRIIYDELKPHLKNYNFAVGLYETPTSSCYYDGENN